MLVDAVGCSINVNLSQWPIGVMSQYFQNFVFALFAVDGKRLLPLLPPAHGCLTERFVLNKLINLKS